MVVGWHGSSITANSNSYAFRVRADTHLYQDYPALSYSAINNTVSGQNSWANLVRLSTILNANPNLVVLDCANDASGNHCAKSLEATIRRIWAANPNTRIVGWNFFAVSDPNVNANVNSPVNEAAIAEQEALFAAYGVPLLDYWGTIQQRVNSEGNNLTEYMSDTIHPNSGGHTEAYPLLEPYLLSGGGTKPAVLPSRLYDNGDYENAPTIKNGTAYDSRSGTWSDTGTRTQSSEAGAIITFSATCQSYGCYRADGGTNNVQVSIDGGAYAAANFYPNGTEIAGGRGAHTIAIKVVSGTVRIDEFWAV